MKTKIFLTILSLLLIGGSGGSAYYFYTKYQAAQIALKNPDQVAQAQVNTLLAKVGKLMLLPTDETPSVATVLDKDKLKDQPFFAKAENGDKVIIYTKAAEAILYREATNLIIAVAPITMTQPSPSPVGSASPAAKPAKTTKAVETSPEPSPVESPVPTP